MKALLLLSVLCGILFAILSCVLLLFILPEDALMLSAAAGLLFSLLLFSVLVICDKRREKSYAAFEATILSPVFCKTSGNFNLGGKIRNGRIYFCDSGIVFASLEEKPLVVEELLLPDIEKYAFDNIHMNIYTKDGREFLITTPDAANVLEILKKRDWIA